MSMTQMSSKDSFRFLVIDFIFKKWCLFFTPLPTKFLLRKWQNFLTGNSIICILRCKHSKHKNKHDLFSSSQLKVVEICVSLTIMNLIVVSIKILNMLKFNLMQSYNFFVVKLFLFYDATYSKFVVSTNSNCDLIHENHGFKQHGFFHKK